MKITEYIRTKLFFKHLLLSSVTALIFLWLIFLLAGWYTDHGETVEVPDFNGKNISELNKFIEDKEMYFEIIDSIYDPEAKPGIVFKQEPEPGEAVKRNRTVYLYVNSLLPPQIVMPKLVDRSLRQATAMIVSYGLKVGKVKAVSDPCSNCVLKQMVNGKEVQPGETIRKGSVIDLWVGKGSDNEQVAIPSLIGLTLCEAKQKLLSSSLTIGAVIAEAGIKDSCKAYVYKQSPKGSAESMTGVGAGVDVYITNDKSKIDNANENEFDDE